MFYFIYLSFLLYFYFYFMYVYIYCEISNPYFYFVLFFVLSFYKEIQVVYWFHQGTCTQRRQAKYFWGENGIDLVAYVWKEEILRQTKSKLSKMQRTQKGRKKEERKGMILWAYWVSGGWYIFVKRRIQKKQEDFYCFRAKKEKGGFTGFWRHWRGTIARKPSDCSPNSPSMLLATL